METDAYRNALNPYNTQDPEGGFNFGLVEKPKSLKQMVYENLHRAIISRVLIQGRVYTESELATKLSISRTPVREALLDLIELMGEYPSEGERTYERGHQ